MTHQHHDHDHPNSDEPHSHEHRLPPSGQGTVLLDIGDGVGALVVHTPSSWNGVEIEIARRGEQHQFVHTEVRERVLPGGSRYAGVFPAIADGEYTLLPAGERSPVEVTIRSGQVTEVVIES